MNGTYEDKIKLIEAARDGAVMQYRYVNSSEEWTFLPSPNFNFDTFEYRVKPEPTVDLRELFLSGAIVRIAGIWHRIASLDPLDGVVVISGQHCTRTFLQVSNAEYSTDHGKTWIKF